MATHLVNLDALIKRADFEAVSGNSAANRRLGNELDCHDLEVVYFQLLRKPDFQRETSSWSAERVADFVESFLNGDVIPAVIMWWSPDGTVFVIDGAHRLSALMAWVHDDYGEGSISRQFWGDTIPLQQKKLAVATRALVTAKIGDYKRLKDIAQNPPVGCDPVVLKRARSIATFKIDLQWVEGNAASAEASFFKINGSASIIDPTELAVIKARRKPNAIATRALMNAGTGHKYWLDFPAYIDEIESLAKRIYDSLFKPLYESPIKTTDLPIGGQAYSADAFKMILDLVNLVNGVTPAMWLEPKHKTRRSDAVQALGDDTDGSATAAYLEAVKKAAILISDHEYSGSLGLHPVVYFYDRTGKFQPMAFLATLKFVLELKEQDKFGVFTAARKAFEEFLITHRHFVSAVGHGYGSRTRPLLTLVKMYWIVLDQIRKGVSDHAVIVRKLLEEPSLHPLIAANEKQVSGRTRREFSRDTKSEAYLREAIDSPVRCRHCGARLHSRAITIDHATRKEDGGTGDVSNAQLMHPYCNSGDKESRIADARGGGLVIPGDTSHQRQGGGTEK